MGGGGHCIFCCVSFFLVKSGQRTDPVAFTTFHVALKQPKLKFVYLFTSSACKGKNTLPVVTSMRGDQNN